MKRRRIRRRRRIKQNSGMKFVAIIGIIIMAIVGGYMTARFVIAPLLGYDTAVLNPDLPTLSIWKDEKKDETTAAKEKESREEPEEGYALQYGLFSSKASAEELKDELEQSGIACSIRKKKGKYQVIGRIFEKKENALNHLKSTDNHIVEDVFVTVVQ